MNSSTITKEVKLKSSPLPSMLNNLMYTNQLLKIFAIGSLVCVTVSLFVIFYQISLGPTILTFDSDGRVFKETANLPSAESFIKESIFQYVSRRYTWTPETVTSKMNEATLFISDRSKDQFKNAVQSILKFSTERSVTQKILISNIEINLKEKFAIVLGDRITSIQGLKAVGDVKLQLFFESGDRTTENPWGIYITKEKENL